MYQSPMSPEEAWVRNANIFRNGEVQKGSRPSDPETAQTPLHPRIWGRRKAESEEANFKGKEYWREDKRRQSQWAILNFMTSLLSSHPNW